jgi:hypothetical protein
MTDDDLVKRIKALNEQLEAARRDAKEAEAYAAALEAERDGLLRLVEEASDPDFLFGAMDNVHDMDVSLMDYACAASRAIRASVLQTEGTDE